MTTLRLRPILLTLFVGFTALFLMLVTASIYFYLSNLITTDTTERRLELMSEIKNQVSIRLSDIEEITRTLISHPTLMETISTPYSNVYETIEGQRKASNLLNLFLYTKPDLHSIRIYTEVFKDAPMSEYSNEKILTLSSFKWKKQMEGSVEDSIWIGTHLEPNANKELVEVVSYVHPIYSRMGKKVGYVEINLNASTFQMMSNVNPNQNRSLLMILDQENQEIMRLTPEVEDIQFEIEVKKDQTNGYWSSTIDGEEFLILYSSMSYKDMSIVELIPYSEMYKLLDAIQRLMWIFALLGIAISIPVAYYLSKAITRPLAQILAGFKKVESGNFDIRMTRYSILEINQLYKGYNQMVIQLKQSIDRLDEEHKLKREAEINALQSQINPHFLYNTLDMVNWMAWEQGQDEMAMILSKISRMYRISLSLGKGKIPLREETEHARLYLQIQKARFSHKFSFEIDIDPLYSEVMVPKIILQPFIENSIIHGYSQDSEGLVVHIRATSTHENKLQIIIDDNGLGLKDEDDEIVDLSQSELSHQATGTSGYGINNVRQRLALYYGNDYNLSILNRTSGGVKVTITIPIK